ncbi:MAG: hypothetical protein R3E75_03575 [Steroidobacteraceae bacterium]|nr:hypothetical protein [Nevskiaceae bacterium]MCP5339150.1 hypothetical protein [Nevskiaceae bacterium]MCP5466989.1 hypothetical protein [Nevskiaceae bacterium]MCP5472121.1 hypothetical protein [Nevskiaceae bacterium]
MTGQEKGSLGAVPPLRTDYRLAAALAAPVARLALRQQNQRALLPALLHEVNGSLNGLTLSTELLARVPPRPGAADAAAQPADLLQRTRTELSRLKTILRSMERHLAPAESALGGLPRTPFDAVMQEVQAVLMPAVRRNQLAWQPAVAPTGAAVAVARGAEETFDLLAGFAIIAIEAAPAGSTLEPTTGCDGERVLFGIRHAGTARTGFGLELHRELLRAAVAEGGSGVDWWQLEDGCVARLALRRAVD